MLETRFTLWVSSCLWLVFSLTPGILSFPYSAGLNTELFVLPLYARVVCYVVLAFCFTAPSKSNNEVIVSLSQCP